MTTNISNTTTNGFKSSAGRRLAARAPRNEKTRAAIAAGVKLRQRSFIFLEYRKSDVVVPQIDESLLVPNNVGNESWGNNTIIAGSWISPPPPAMASIKPARKAKRHRVIVVTA